MVSGNPLGGYRSPYAPKYTVPYNVNGFKLSHAMKFGTIAGSFGAAVGVMALFFLGDVPRVRNDILMKIPVLGEYWDRRIAPEDNPF